MSKYAPEDRQEVAEHHSIETGFFEGDITSVVTKIMALRAKYPDALNVKFTHEHDYEDGWYYNLVVERMETDDEYNARLRALEKRRATLARNAANKKTEVQKLLETLPEKKRRALLAELQKEFASSE